MKNKITMSLLCTLIIAGAIVIAGYSIKIYLPKELPPEINAALKYVKERLMNSKNVVETYPREAKVIPYYNNYKRESLSETVGMWMLILEALNKKEDFDLQARALREYFFLPNGTLTWRVRVLENEELAADPVCATIDDLRIIRALLLAWERWNREEYKFFALSLAMAVKRTSVYRGILLEQPVVSSMDSFRVDLSYLDLKTMLMLSHYDSEWKTVYENSLKLLINGQKENGFFYDNYEVDQGRYFSTHKNFINQLICAINLAECGIEVDSFMRLVKSKWEKDKQLHGIYNPETGEPITNYESSIIYALAYRLAKMEKERTLANELRNRLIKHNMQEKDVLWAGSLGQNYTHSFDHLNVLYVWTIFRERLWL